jgi:molybdate transport system substrate-binding protein
LNSSVLRKLLSLSFWFVCFGLVFEVKAAQLKIAVASNFIEPMRELGQVFESKTGHKVLTSFGSSGKLTIQIEQGAPFDVFMSADADKPNRLVMLGFAQKEHRQTYALGRLALVSHNREVSSHSLCSLSPFRLAIANPELAPYGQASMAFIESLSCHIPLKKKIILGENIGQSFHFFASGAADYALVALSQVQTRPELITSHVIISEAKHQPIIQDMVILKRSKHQAVAFQWFKFIQSEQAGQIILSYGYQRVGDNIVTQIDSNESLVEN